MKTTIYVIRHGESIGNVKGEFHGITDEGLSEKGYRQLEPLAERCKEMHLDAIYASPLIRTMETAAGVNKYYQYEIHTDPRLMEINVGHWERVPYNELEQRFPDEYKVWKETPHLCALEGGETMENVYNRMKEAVLAIVKANPGKTVAIVTHGCAIRNLYCWLSGKGHAYLKDVVPVRNTSIIKAEFEEDLVPHLIYSHDDAHLSEELKKLSPRIGG